MVMSTTSPRRTLFLNPIEDENGYGLLARTALRMGHHNLRTFSHYVCPEMKGACLFSSYLGQVRVMGSWVGPAMDLEVDEVFARFSDMALCRPFARLPISAEGLDKPQIKPQPRGLSTFAAAPRWAWKPFGMSFPKAWYCPQCAEEQYDQFGQTTWLRSHNCGGTRVCFKHKCWLESQSINKSTLELLPLRANVDRQTSGHGEVGRQLVAYAQLVKELLDADLPWLCHERRGKLFRAQLHKLEAEQLVDYRELYPILSDRTVQRFMMAGSDAGLPDLRIILRLVGTLFGGAGPFIAAVRSEAKNQFNVENTAWRKGLHSGWFDLFTR